MNSKNTKNIISLLAFFILFTGSIWAQEVKDYASVIKSADEYYQNKDYYNAKATYQLAAKLNPEEAYPNEKVQEIINLLKAEMAVRGEYDEYIETADEAFDVKDYETAIVNYEKALALIAYEAHPKSRLEESQTLLEAANLKNSVYEQAIKTADEHFVKQEYEQAISFYRDAANVDAAQKYPNDQIIKIANILQNQDSNRQKYEQAILKADQQLNYQKFSEALSQYELALETKPGDEYAIAQIAKMKVFIEKEKEYDQITAVADKLYVDKDLAAAKSEYQKAIALLPEKTYAANMLTKINSGLDKEQAKADKLETDYAKAIADGDQLFKDKKYQSAFSRYSKAVELKPDEQYPKDQLLEIDILLATGYIEISCFVHENDNGLFDARIQLIEGGSVKETAEIGTNGRHKFKLNLNSNYQIKFYKSNYVQKIFDVNTALPRDVNHNTIFEYDLVVELFPDCSVDLSILDRPLTEITYHKNKGNFYIDEQRAQLVIDRVNELKEECKEVRAQQANREEYDKIIAKADRSFEQKSYEKAIESYTEASLLIADEQYPKDKLAEIQSVLEAADKYQALIMAGDAKYQAKDYENALYDYYAAKNLKPNEVYPQEKIDEIDALINAQKELDASYLAALKIADDLYAVDSLSPALLAYQQTLEIKSEEVYPKSRISEIERRLGAQKELDKKYEDAIANADKLFEQEKLSDAKSAYLIASQIKSEEMYPKYKIEDINTIEEQRRIRAMDGNYADLIAQADAKFEALEYQAALGIYASASELKPKENYPPAQIEIINGLLVKLAADAEKYDELIAQADVEFQAKEYAPSFDNYKLASQLKTEEAYPKDQMAIIEGIMKDFADLELAYQEEIKFGDEQFTASAWSLALGHFQKASELKPSEEYPKTKIAEINALLQGMADKDASYAAAIAEGDSKFDNRDWAHALTSYQTASGLKPTEQYPKDRIAEINQKIKDQEAKQAEYDAIIVAADGHFGTQTYEEAKAKYQEALAILPNETYPQEKIAEIDGILANKEAAYAKAIADGDASFEATEWTAALASYQTALGLKPAEQYPQDRIAEINQKIKDQEAKQAEYDAIIAAADALFGTQTYEDAKAKYQEALTILPSETYPQEKIAEIDGILANKEAAYAKAISDGDASFDASEWTSALASYQTALGLKPAEQYPQDRIAEINQKIKDQEAKQAEYDAIIAAADALFGTQTYEDAKAKYQEALTILPSETYPQEKIAEIDGILANKEAAYAKAIADGDASFDATEWTSALDSYQTALGLKPAEQYPQDRITEINQKIKDQAAQQAAYDALIVEADALFGTQTYSESKGKYQEALVIFANESHPQQRIAEIDGLLQAMADKNAAYQAAITKADAYYDQSEWEMARTAYEDALEIKAEEEYPKTRIADIDAKLEAIAAQKAQYDALIASADELFAASTYVDSRAKYQEALTILSNETYPTEQIAKIDALLKEMADQDALYAQLIQSADAALAEKSYEISLGQYKQASEMKTEEAYPKEKIAEIEAILLQIAENDRLYSEAIAAADQNRDAESYNAAITKYEEASALKTEEAYPKEQILAIQNLLKSQAEQQAAYEAAIAAADEKFAIQEWQVAKEGYQEALGIKANEVYPQTQIQEIDKKLTELAEMEAAYAKAIADADAFYQSNSWQDALTNYTLASQIKTEEAYPKERISELNNLLGELAAQQAQYDALVAEADQLLELKDYAASIDKYEAALVIKANEAYPQTQLKLIEGILLELAAQQKQYDALIKEADKQFVKEEWSLALPKYQEALVIKTEEVYPQEQINIINEKLQAIADLQAQYDAIILEADQLFTALDYETAITKYEAASILKVEEEYPKQKMSEIRDILEELARKNAEYDKVIAKADDLLQQESFAKSKEQYQEASLIFTDRTYPQEQIVKIDELVAKHEQYQVLINTADGEFKERQFEASLGHFQEALAILPAKTYPAEKITEIQTILDAMAATRAAYDAAVTQGDAQLAASEHEAAKQSYQSALEHLSTEVYPRQKIMEIDQILQDIARKRMEFDKAIAAGDAAFKEQGYDMALTKYLAALEILPEELYPQQKIEEINGILALMADQQARFESLVAQGDQAFVAEDYETSISLFTQAQAIYVHETYPPQKIEEARTALAKIQREKDVAYQKAIDNGDKSFRSKKWDTAKLAYQEASEIKTEELYPQEKLAEINAILEKELLAQQKEYDRYIADGERFYGTKYYQESILSFEKALTVFPFEKYPSEMIDKIFELIKKNSMVHILDGKMTIAQNHEEKFTFDPISFKDRSENYILLEVKLSDPEQAVKLFVNFGKGGSQSGGYSIPLKNSDGYHSYFVSIGKQVKWVNQDNDYISLLPEGGSVEVKLIKISRNGI
ncbi:hypothetical protein HNS38_08400 [Lentimicrobium sp. L6]|uniref:hypothetical protein n=1 Tax=Lentimicrobium sp. L6 TaxID=2735916 RepID=UPI001551D5DF|nr:hypothetical protein [Lentimicrobium sp. L6]NPD84774.1 hypothetical protein [Lentimicrobium sp. L6]